MDTLLNFSCKGIRFRDPFLIFIEKRVSLFSVYFFRVLRIN